MPGDRKGRPYSGNATEIRERPIPAATPTSGFAWRTAGDGRLALRAARTDARTSIFPRALAKASRDLAEQRLDAVAWIVVDVGEAMGAHQRPLVKAAGGAGRHQHFSAKIVIGERFSGKPAYHL